MHDLTRSAGAYRLGSLVVAPSLNRVVRDGQTVDVEPRVMAVLAALAATPGEVVTRAALFETVWADAVVNDEALTRAVSELRKALGDEGRSAVETIRGRGYRLAASIQFLETESRHAPSRVAPPAEPRASLAGATQPTRRAATLAALALGVIILGVALWEIPDRDAHRAQVHPADAMYRLDSTSQYYLPGASELGVHYDSSTGNYFRFVPESD